MAAREAVRLAPQRYSCQLVLCDVERACRHWAAAADAAERALELAPDRAETHNAIGLVALSRYRYREAEAHFRVALGRDPENAQAMNNLGLALLRQRRRAQAIHYFAEASRLDPRLTTPRRNAVTAAQAGTAGLLFVTVAEMIHVVEAGFKTGVVIWAAAVVVLFGGAVMGSRWWAAWRSRGARPGTPGVTDPRASPELMRQLRRQRPTLRFRTTLRALAPVALLAIGAYCTIAGFDLTGVGHPIRAVLLVVGLACLATLAWLVRRARRAG